MSMNAYGRENLMYELQVLCFYLDDIILYLDTHPTDPIALDCYRQFKDMKDECEREYVSRFGPISADNVMVCNEWSWVNNPWPWE